MEALKNTTIDQHRHDHHKAHKIENGGWHFSFFGNAEDFKLKLACYEHTENNNEMLPQMPQRRLNKV